MAELTQELLQQIRTYRLRLPEGELLLLPISTGATPENTTFQLRLHKKGVAGYWEPTPQALESCGVTREAARELLEEGKKAQENLNRQYRALPTTAKEQLMEKLPETASAGAGG